MSSIPSRTLLLIFLAALPVSADDKLDFFETRIRPVLVEHCVKCHGPQKQESDLRVDHISFLLKKGHYGKSVVPGKPGRSVLLQALAHTAADLKMPEGGKRLGDLVVRDFRRWIQDGAVWPKEPVPKNVSVHRFNLAARKQRLPWIWRVPQRQRLPLVKRSQWVSTAIDRFVLAQLEKRGLQPASPAKSTVWLRRVHFAITGLPPTPDAIRQFLQDDTPRARDKVVDGLLASPHYGERWARHWMDLVRYAESRGHESDFLIANAWRYRNYLIQALNDDVPYDQFVVEHLAGDIIATPRVDRVSGANQSILGTGWAFLGEEIHSPVDIRQDECDRVDNKIDVLSKTFLGLTVACARCHDHKFDAIKQSDYYALAGYVLSSSFRQVRFQSMEHNRRIARQLDAIRERTRQKMLEMLRRELTKVVKSRWSELVQQSLRDKGHVLHFVSQQIDDKEGTRRLREKLRTAESRYRESLRGVQVIADYSRKEAKLTQDGFTFGQRVQRRGDLLIGDERQPVRGVAQVAAAVKDSFWEDLRLAAGNEQDPARLKSHQRAGRTLRTNKVPITSGRLFYLMTGEADVYAGVDSHLLVLGPLHGHLTRRLASKGRWIEHNVARSSGTRVQVQFTAVNGKPLAIEKVVQSEWLPKNLPPPDDLMLELTQREAVTSKALQLVVLRTLSRLGRRQLSTGEAKVANWLVTSADLLPDSIRQRLATLANDYRRSRAGLRKQVRRESATAVAWLNGNGVNERVLLRGKPQRPDAVAARGLPAAFEFPATDTKDSGRLQLAQQIVNKRNPLAPRVIVNRVWHHLFGRGIVATVDNFGYLGSRPTHPKLLDHLAWQFVHQDQWSIKRLIRRLVLTNTYAMASRPSDPVAQRKDPNNIWLHRMLVRRLEAEAIRDAVLVVSGRFDRRLLGRPVPVHLTEFVVGRGRPGRSGPLDGAGRRSVYTSVRRNFLPTLMLTFDTPAPFSTVGRRTVTNVPAQSLALMNDPFIYQQSGVWAKRTLIEMPRATDGERIGRLYLQAFGRRPVTAELRQCTAALRQIRQQVGSNREAEVWRELCHALFSVNDFIYLQ